MNQVDRDVSLDISRARHLVDVTMEIVGDLNDCDTTEIVTRERACSVLACLQRELQDIERVLYPA